MTPSLKRQLANVGQSMSRCKRWTPLSSPTDSSEEENILAVLFHGFLTFSDDAYRLIGATLPTRKIFFEHIRALAHCICFPSCKALMEFMMRGLEIGPYEVQGAAPRGELCPGDLLTAIGTLATEK